MSAFGPWTVVQHNGRRTLKTQRGKNVNSQTGASETLGEKVKPPVKPLVTILKCDSGEQPTDSTASGSRFAPLEINADPIMDMEDMDTGAEKGEISGGIMQGVKELRRIRVCLHQAGIRILMWFI